MQIYSPVHIPPRVVARCFSAARNISKSIFSRGGAGKYLRHRRIKNWQRAMNVDTSGWADITIGSIRRIHRRTYLLFDFPITRTWHPDGSLSP